MATPVRGLEFTHKSMLDPTWSNGPGQTFTRDCPKALCVVTRVGEFWVWYRYSDAILGTLGARKTSAFMVRRDTFESDYMEVPA